MALRGLLPITFLALTGCAHLPGLGPHPDFPLRCISACGAKLYGAAYGGTCSSFDAAEARLLGAFATLEPDACRKLSGVIISVQPAEAWTDDYGRRIAGATRCERRSIQLGNAPWWSGAYAHELTHLLVDCPKEDLEHKDWPLSYWLAIDQANARAP